jgi:hypothetical protein
LGVFWKFHGIFIGFDSLDLFWGISEKEKRKRIYCLENKGLERKSRILEETKGGVSKLFEVVLNEEKNRKQSFPLINYLSIKKKL